MQWQNEEVVIIISLFIVRRSSFVVLIAIFVTAVACIVILVLMNVHRGLNNAKNFVDFLEINFSASAAGKMM